jgi:hypothetical protein
MPSIRNSLTSLRYNGSVSTQKVSISIPKSLVAGFAVSIVVLVVSALILQKLVTLLPFTPEHKADDFLNLNNHSSIAYSTQYVQGLQQTSGIIDAFLVTPLSLIVAGVVMAQFLPRTTWPTTRVVRASAWSGLVLSAFIIFLGLELSDVAQSMAGQTMSSFDYHKLPIAGLQIIPSALAYTLGGWLGSKWRRERRLLEPIPAPASAQ